MFQNLPPDTRKRFSACLAGDNVSFAHVRVALVFFLQRLWLQKPSCSESHGSSREWQLSGTSQHHSESDTCSFRVVLNELHWAKRSCGNEKMIMKPKQSSTIVSKQSLSTQDLTETPQKTLGWKGPCELIWLTFPLSSAYKHKIQALGRLLSCFRIPYPLWEPSKSSRLFQPHNLTQPSGLLGWWLLNSANPFQ